MLKSFKWRHRIMRASDLEANSKYTALGLHVYMDNNTMISTVSPMRLGLELRMEEEAIKTAIMDLKDKGYVAISGRSVKGLLK